MTAPAAGPVVAGTPFVRSADVAWETVGEGVRRQVLGAGDCFYVAADLEHGVVAREAGTLVDVFTPAREDFLPRS